MGAQDQQKINTSDPDNSASVLGIENSIWITGLGVVIGVLALCILMLFCCWCKNRKRTHKLAEQDNGMEIARIISDTSVTSQSNIMAMDGSPSNLTATFTATLQSTNGYDNLPEVPGSPNGLPGFNG